VSCVRRCAALVVVVASLAMPTSASSAQDAPDDLPAVTATPVDPDAPNGGQWFAVVGEPGARLEAIAELFNPADVDQMVALSLSDLSIDEDGMAHLGDEAKDVGAWGAFDHDRVTVPAHETIRTTFHLTVPADADPGDHLGAVVVESIPTEAVPLQVVKRAAKRLYVTVPGDADAEVELDSVDVGIRGGVLPRSADVVAVVRNTGDVRLATKVVIDGVRAEGPEVVMSQSVETYRVRRPVPVWGGRRSFHAVVTTRTLTAAGPTAEGTAKAWVFPGWIVLAVFLLVLLVMTLRELAKRLR
jgi:hypothetical protein